MFSWPWAAAEAVAGRLASAEVEVAARDPSPKPTDMDDEMNGKCPDGWHLARFRHNPEATSGTAQAHSRTIVTGGRSASSIAYRMSSRRPPRSLDTRKSEPIGGKTKPRAYKQ